MTCGTSSGPSDPSQLHPVPPYWATTLGGATILGHRSTVPSRKPPGTNSADSPLNAKVSMSWARVDAELLHEAGEVSFEPLFHSLAIHNPVDVGARDRHFPACSWDALKLAGVLDPIAVVDDHHVALCDEELGRDIDVEGGQVGGEKLFECLAASDWVRHDAAVVSNEVTSVQFIDDLHVSLVPDLVSPAQNDCLVSFSGHGTVPWSWDNAQLLHEAQHVQSNPLFHNLAVHNAVDLIVANGDFPSRRGDPLKRAGVLGA